MVEVEHPIVDERFEGVVNLAKKYVDEKLKATRLPRELVVSTLRHWSDVYCGYILDSDNKKKRERYFMLSEDDYFMDFISGGFFRDVAEALGHYSFPGTDPEQKKEMAQIVPKAFAKVAEKYQS